MTEQEISNWATNDTCIIGVSNRYFYKAESFDDPLYTAEQRTYLDTVKVHEAYAAITDTNLSRVRVGVIDTLAAVHPDLDEISVDESPGILKREDLRSAESIGHASCSGVTITPESPNNPHGTFVSGIIAANQNNTLGVAGIARNAQVLSYGIGNCEGGIPSEEIGNAVQAAIRDQVEVVNLSLGGATYDDPALRQAMISALNTKMVVIVSAGNSAKDLSKDAYYPATYGAQYLGLIPVAWGTESGGFHVGNGRDSGSNFGPDHIKVLAPGSNIVSTAPIGAYAPVSPGYSKGSGSSFSAPIVAAAAAIAIGFLKHNRIQYDETVLEYLLTRKGIRKVTALQSRVREGAVLDFVKLMETLEFLKATGANPSPISISEKLAGYDAGKKAAYIEFLASWDLEATHLGARLGLFDGSCGFSEPCIIQSFDLEGNKGSQEFRVERNQTIPVLPSLSDPEFGTYITVAIYYPVYNKDGEKKNNYATDAIARINLRDFDSSRSNSPFIGRVTNIRSDMQYLYVQGWTCVESSNKAVPVELIGPTDTPIVSSYAYSYPYMVPHSTPIDSNGTYSSSGGPFVAYDIKVNHTGQSRYLAGLEGHATLMLDCKTLTIAHGFEFAIPLATIKDLDLSEKQIKVKAHHPNKDATIFLADRDGNQAFTVPEVNFQPSISHDLEITRGPNALAINGNICSESPSHVMAEISFSKFNITCRLAGADGFPFHDKSECYLPGKGAPIPMVRDPSLTDRNQFIVFNVFTDTFFTIIDLELTPEELQEHKTKYPTRWPNARIGDWAYKYGGSNSNEYKEFIRNRGIRAVTPNAQVDSILYESITLYEKGPLRDDGIEANNQDKAGSSFEIIFPQYWDYMDVGEPYTPSAVAYPLDPKSTIGDYIATNYGGVSKLMREVKKYEVPLGSRTNILSVKSLSKGPKRPCGFQFDLSEQITQIKQRNPYVASRVHKIMKVGEAPIKAVDIEDLETMDLSMREVPIDIRFFQDGVMILHVLSDYASDFYSVETLGRGKND